MEPLLLVERCESGLEVRVRGEVVPVDEDGEMERPERTGEKAVRRLRRGVKDWKRLVRVEETILADVVCTKVLPIV